MFLHHLFGIDTSEFQKGLRLSHHDNVGFVYAKATEGHTYADPEYEAFKTDARDHGKLFFAYHFLRSDSSPVDQARHFLSVEKDRSIPVVVDVERSGTSRPGYPHLSAFLKTVQSARHVIGGAYYPRWWWNLTGQPDLSRLPGMLIASEYPSSESGHFHDLYKHVPDSAWARYGGKLPAILQFSSNGRVDGYSGAVDLNVFRGTRHALAASGFVKDFGVKAPAPSAPSSERRPLQVQIDELRHHIRDLRQRVTNLENGGK